MVINLTCGILVKVDNNWCERYGSMMFRVSLICFTDSKKTFWLTKNLFVKKTFAACLYFLFFPLNSVVYFYYYFSPEKLFKNLFCSKFLSLQLIY